MHLPPHILQLIAYKHKIQIRLTLATLILYFGFIFMVAYYPDLFAQKITPKYNISWGIAIAFVLIVAFCTLTALYVYLANTRFDTITKALCEHANKEKA